MENKIIFKTISGSHLYGTNTETSDIDYLGVFIPNEKYILGLEDIDEIDDSIVDKNENGKNTNKAIDTKYFSIYKFVKLSLSNNPTIIELLFPNEKSTLILTDEFKELISIREKFLCKNIIKKFIGYANSQKHKMMIKGDKFFEMIEMVSILKKYDPKKYVVELKTDDNFLKHTEKIRNKIFNECQTDKKRGYVFGFHDQFLTIGDINIPVNNSIKQAIERLNKRLNAASNRSDLILKYGMDTKFASHLIRLLLECKEIIKTKNIVFPLTYRGLLVDIKNGKYNIYQILDMANSLEQEIEEENLKSDFPDKPDFDYINNTVIKIIKNYLMEN